MSYFVSADDYKQFNEYSSAQPSSYVPQPTGVVQPEPQPQPQPTGVVQPEPQPTGVVQPSTEPFRFNTTTRKFEYFNQRPRRY